MRRWAGAGLALGLLLGACADDGGDDGRGGDEAAPTTTDASDTTGASGPSEPDERFLLQGTDLAEAGFASLVTARPFDAQHAPRLSLCGRDLRADQGATSGLQSRFTNDEVEVAHTVSGARDAEAFLAAFRAAVDDCAGPWTDPPLPAGGGPVQREITGAFPLPEVEVDASAAVVRSRNRLGSTETIVVVLVHGDVVSSLSISGLVGGDFAVATPAVEAAAARLREGQSPAGP